MAVFFAVLFALAAPAQADVSSAWHAYLAGHYQAALGELRPLAEAGDPEAQYDMGALYSDGLAVARSYRTAAHWFERAAEQGHARAQFSLGFLYYHGAGVNPAEDPVARDATAAARWLVPAAESGRAMAQLLLGRLYRTGKGVPQDEDAALRWCLAAAEQDAAAAQYEAGVMLSARWRGKDSYIEAYKWLRLAAAKRYPDAAENLALLARRLERPDIDRGEALAQAWQPVQ